MTNFYHRASPGQTVPKILGLTASPLMKSNPESLDQIESILSSICRTPTLHRAELKEHVQMPNFESVFYDDNSPRSIIPHTATMTKLLKVLGALNIHEDPYVVSLKRDDSDRAKRQLAKVLLNHKTWTREQINRVYRTSEVMNTELGSFAVDYYIRRVVKNCESLTLATGIDGFGMQEVSSAEKQYLVDALHQVIPVGEVDDKDNKAPSVSYKVSKLIDILVRQHDTTRGIVFVNQRATAEVLAAILKRHNITKNKFSFGTFGGNSMTAHRTREVAHVVDFAAQKNVLHRFRNGDLNIVIATDVLEEGIDVPACNLVICFDCPKNLKSFVQRRGRARQKSSKLIMLFDSQMDGRKLREFQALEENMKQL